MKRITLVVLMILFASGILGCGGSKTETSVDDNATLPGSSPTQNTTTEQTAFQDSGNAEAIGDKTTGTFHLGSGQKTLKYTVSGSGELVLFSVTIKPAGFEGYVDSLTGPIDQSGSGEIPLNESEGDYYLKIQASNCAWSVTILESK